MVLHSNRSRSFQDGLSDFFDMKIDDSTISFLDSFDLDQMDSPDYEYTVPSLTIVFNLHFAQRVNNHTGFLKVCARIVVSTALTFKPEHAIVISGSRNPYDKCSSIG